MANDHLIIECLACGALQKMFAYYPSQPTDAGYDVRPFVERHVYECIEPTGSLDDEAPLKIWTEGGYVRAYGQLPKAGSELPDGRWRTTRTEESR